MVRHKAVLTISVDPKLVEWLDKKIRDKTFASRSHGVEFCLAQVRKGTPP
jgi:metal-responsive CopG/Arc/MetJ family transcriptional regulator